MVYIIMHSGCLEIDFTLENIICYCCYIHFAIFYLGVPTLYMKEIYLLFGSVKH